MSEVFQFVQESILYNTASEIELNFRVHYKI